MLKLKNVSKFYYNKGVVASGFSKINLELDIGEFVVITGESGSGKSTLLNVISGLDSYEEGEMYINGKETSHYNEEDFELYRRKYIGNIFQNFNLVNSYTVYQNIELVLLLNGYKKHEIKEKVLNLIKQVDMMKYRNRKCSKLSGGQKQRVAIARALAKDTSIIVADEPTGNLDSRSALSIIKLLYEISKDKLVVIVTHNYEQVAEYATRTIKMHDGKIIEDKLIKKNDSKIEVKASHINDITKSNKILLGLRNTFNIIPKFLLLLLVFMFIVFSFASMYTSNQKQTDETNEVGYNTFFNDKTNKRIIIKKKDKTAFLDEDYEVIKSLDNIDYIIKNDVLLDTYYNLTGNDFNFNGFIKDIKNLVGTIDIGRMPTAANEVVLVAPQDNYYFYENIDKVFDTNYAINNTINNDSLTDNNIKIVGIKYNENVFDYDTNIYASNDILDILSKTVNKEYSMVTSLLNNRELKTEGYYSNLYNLHVSNNVKKGNIYISEELNVLCPNFNCMNQKMNINIKQLYFEKEITLKVRGLYNSTNYKKIIGLDNFDILNGTFFINQEDYNNIFNENNYQSSIFIKSEKEYEKTINELNKLGITALYIKEALINPLEDGLEVISIFRTIWIIVLTIGIFFISYFIIKLILKSRNVYYSTIRILGANRKVTKRLLDIELFTVYTISYLIFIIAVILVKNNIINVEYISDLVTYFKIYDYFILYLILLLMSYLISNRFAKKLFKDSALKTYRSDN